MDVLTPEQRRKNMRAIKSKDTSVEIKLRKALWEKGIRYRKNYKKLPGRPDIALTQFKIAIFCDSTFFHGYDWENKKKRIQTNRQYWIDKIEHNMQRDENINQKLTDLGWTVIRFWDIDIKKHLDECVETIIKSIIIYTDDEYCMNNSLYD